MSPWSSVPHPAEAAPISRHIICSRMQNCPIGTTYVELRNAQVSETQQVIKMKKPGRLGCATSFNGRTTGFKTMVMSQVIQFFFFLTGIIPTLIMRSFSLPRWTTSRLCVCLPMRLILCNLMTSQWTRGSSKILMKNLQRWPPMILLCKIMTSTISVKRL